VLAKEHFAYYGETTRVEIARETARLIAEWLRSTHDWGRDVTASDIEAGKWGTE